MQPACVRVQTQLRTYLPTYIHAYFAAYVRCAHAHWYVRKRMYMRWHALRLRTRHNTLEGAVTKARPRVPSLQESVVVVLACLQASRTYVHMYVRASLRTCVRTSICCVICASYCLYLHIKQRRYARTYVPAEQLLQTHVRTYIRADITC